ncbi:imidazole glycerol phosphate synthase subunit HisH [Parasedimentitalea psychrophila]|uniref:Imidazole glycerol phosphate synthase subunit HisH n=1 Tax=Parasedimentitalea psychrophila TaxID=2997337 RepID=A0A9Y2P1F5_9RHOB|nr:imidazole glycerol phosphate synthase subunit HisH [Parasedimentitalea psychrophila]WIY25546.1 imidazole glycerol phosphate synthase subunit HisH [Parasedimentitalea psychrophila]
MLTAIIDYESGNLHSAAKAFQRMAHEMDAGEVVVTSDADVVARADRLVLPGDGAFPACATELRGHKGLYDAMVEAVEQKGRPFLGICVGMQLMATTGHEYEKTAGIGWIAGDVVKITPSDSALKVPHMGWNNLVIDSDHAIFDGISSGDHTYFVHSYQFQVRDPAERLAHVDYGGEVTAVIGRDTMIGMQFHPEKSQDVGLRMIGNFLIWKP